MFLFYINCMYKSTKSSYEASFRVEIVCGQNVLLCTCIWSKCLCPKRPGQNVRPPLRNGSSPLITRDLCYIFNKPLTKRKKKKIRLDQIVSIFGKQ